jgi:PheRS DNA binding domain 3
MVAEKGSHEAVVYNLVPPGGIAQAELMKVRFLRGFKCDRTFGSLLAFVILILLIF